MVSALPRGASLTPTLQTSKLSAVNRLFFAVFFALVGCSPAAPPPDPVPAAITTVAAASAPRQLSWSIEATLPHDPAAFTQGLLWHDGFLFESTGLVGQSEVRRLDPRSMQVLKRWKLPPQVFGEGLAHLGGKFYNLTWQSRVGFVLDENFRPLARFRYANEGWGLTSDGKRLLQSDGTATLTWRDTKFASLGTLQVLRDGVPVANLNELEWIAGYVWANVWQTDEIVVIDPQNGRVVAQLDLSGLLPATARNGTEDVLNGIAYDPTSGRIYVTGKKWPRLFSIRVEGLPVR